MKMLKTIFRWFNKSDLKEFVVEQHTFNKVIIGKFDLLIELMKKGK